MTKKLCSIVIPLLLFILNVNGQDYFRYQKIINSIDDDVLNNNLKSALLKADTIYRDYDFVYARHCIKALQISCELNDSLKAEIWLRKAFLQGVPKWLVNMNEITKKVSQYENTRQVLLSYEGLHKQYISKINLPLRRTVDSLRLLDKKYTDKVNLDNNLFKYVIYGLQWTRNSRKQVKLLKPIIKKWGFPGERLIGFEFSKLDSSISSKRLKYYGPNLSEGETSTMFIHYFSIKRKSLNSLLLPNVKAGFLEAADYGSFNDFQSRKGKNNYYNVWLTDPNKNNLPEIDKRRAEIGLESYEMQQKKFKIVFERRKTKENNSTIALEINH